MNEEIGRASRRKFLKESIQALIATPLAVAAIPPVGSQEGTLLERGDELYPGDSEPEMHGSLDDYE